MTSQAQTLRLLRTFAKQEAAYRRALAVKVVEVDASAVRAFSLGVPLTRLSQATGIPEFDLLQRIVNHAGADVPELDLTDLPGWRLRFVRACAVTHLRVVSSARRVAVDRLIAAVGRTDEMLGQALRARCSVRQLAAETALSEADVERRGRVTAKAGVRS